MGIDYEAAMYVCLCKGVRDHDISALATASANTGSVLRMRDLREQLGVCSECGKCGQRALGLLRQSNTTCDHSCESRSSLPA